MRMPFLTKDKGIAAATSKLLRHQEPSKRWASTNVVITSIRLERMLLHSRATSMSSPGMDSIIPSCVTGTRATRNMSRAVVADCCCNHSMVQFNTASGIGTINSRKQRGNTNH